MGAEDWVILSLILVAIWVVVIPRPVRHAIQGNVGPLLAQSLDALKPIVRGIATATEAAAFRMIVGRPRVNHSQVVDDEIMSSAPIVAPSLPVSPRTDASADGRTPILRPATLDICKALRAHKFTRDEARAFLHPLGWSLGNDTWAQAQPTEDEDEIITPYAGRSTNRKYYPEEPALEYKELEA